MTDLRLLDLFSGIGGFSYAAERLVGGYKTVGFCDNDPFCRQVLQKHWPDVEVFEDVRNTDDFIRCGRVDIITGGYPCQPFSLAGKQKGSEDDRHLWPAMFELIKQKRPAFVIGENVAGHIALGLDEVLFDLESEGYSARPFVIPAVAVDAHHRRDRVWVVARADTQSEPDVTGYAETRERVGSEDVGHSCCGGLQGDDWWRSRQEPTHGRSDVADTDGNRWREERADGRGCASPDRGWQAGGIGRGGEVMADAARKRMEGHGPDREQEPRLSSGEGLPRRDRAGAEPNFWLPEPRLGRVAHGVPGRVDRLKSLGNSIVPQVAAQILRAIREAHDA